MNRELKETHEISDRRKYSMEQHEIDSEGMSWRQSTQDTGLKSWKVAAQAEQPDGGQQPKESRSTTKGGPSRCYQHYLQ